MVKECHVTSMHYKDPDVSGLIFHIPLLDIWTLQLSK